MKVLFHVFGIPVHFLGAMVAVGFVAALIVAYLEAKRKGLLVDKLFDLAIFSAIAGIIGARLLYIVFYNLSFYINHPLDIFKITEGGLSIHGGLAAAIITCYFYIRKNKLDFFKYADAAAPGIILAQGIGRVGCDVFGKPMANPLPWGVNISGQLLHPVQAYEFLLDYIVFFILWRMRKKIKYDGQVFIWYILLFSINRGIVEFFRVNPTLFGWFSVSHLLSVLFIIGAIVTLYFVRKRTSSNITGDEVCQVSGKHEKSSLLIDLLLVSIITAVSLLIYYTAWK